MAKTALLKPKAATRPVSLKEAAYEKIKAYLLTSDSQERVYSERQLSALLDLGLGPVRSAVERLRAEGIVIVSPNHGIQVPDLTPRAIVNFYQLRMAIEPYVIGDLAGRVAGQTLASVERILEEQEECCRRRDVAGYHALDAGFHMELARIHGNEEMVRILAGLRDRQYRLCTKMHLGHPDRLAVTTTQHRGIYDALREGNTEAAETAIREHLKGAMKFFLDPDQVLWGGI